MADSRPPRGLRAAIDLTAATGFEPKVGEDACDSRLSGSTWEKNRRQNSMPSGKRVGRPQFLCVIGLQAGPEAELRRRALRLEDDGRQARRPAREDPMNRPKPVT